MVMVMAMVRLELRLYSYQSRVGVMLTCGREKEPSLPQYMYIYFVGQYYWYSHSAHARGLWQPFCVSVSYHATCSCYILYPLAQPGGGVWGLEPPPPLVLSYLGHHYTNLPVVHPYVCPDSITGSYLTPVKKGSFFASCPSMLTEVSDSILSAFSWQSQSGFVNEAAR